MRVAMTMVVFAALTVTQSAHGQTSADYFKRENEVYRAFGPLPGGGNLDDVLACAGANEVFWTAALEKDPRNPEGREAKRKAGWYSAVALWVFAVDSEVVINAVKEATRHRPRSAVIELARQCRKAPEGWRE